MGKSILNHRPIFFANWCAWGSALGLIPLNASDSPSPPGRQTVNLDQLARAPEEYLIAIAKQMGEATDAELEVFRQHDNWGVALTAAWEEFVLRPTAKDLAVQTLVKDEVIGLRVERWLGFVEGRLRVAPPPNWRSILRGAGISRSDGQQSLPLGFFSDDNPCEKQWYDPFARPDEDDNTEYDANRDLLEVPLGVMWKRVPNRLVLTRKNGQSIALDIDRFKWLPMQDDNHFGSARTLWETQGDHEFLAIFRTWGERFELAALDQRTRDWLWSTQVVGGRDHFFHSGLPDSSHCVTCLVSGETVYVFGHSMFSIYVEGFDLKTGKVQGRFSSSVRMP